MASSKLVILIASLLDLTAFALALTAEFTRSTASVEVDDSLAYYYCVYSSSIATFCGACALLCLIGGQSLKCIHKTKLDSNPGVLRLLAFLSYATSWVSFLQAVVFLVIGSVINAKQTKLRYIHTDDPPPDFCETLRKGVFSAGAALVLVAALTFNFHYVCYSQAISSGEVIVNDWNEDKPLKRSLVSESP